MVTATGSDRGPVVDILKWVTKVLEKNRAPEILFGCEYIEECAQSVIVYRL